MNVAFDGVNTVLCSIERFAMLSEIWKMRPFPLTVGLSNPMKTLFVIERLRMRAVVPSYRPVRLNAAATFRITLLRTVRSSVIHQLHPELPDHSTKAKPAWPCGQLFSMTFPSTRIRRPALTSMRFFTSHLPPFQLIGFAMWLRVISISDGTRL